MTARRQLRFSSLAPLALLLLALAAPRSQAALPLQQSCYPIVINGGFETRNGWTLGGGPLPPQYVVSPTKSGAWAMQIGNAGLSPATTAYSSIFQTLTIPANAVSAELSFWVWTFTEANPGNDLQEALLLVEGANLQSAASPGAVWGELSNSGAYQVIRRSLNSQIGQSFELTFSVYNDGVGGRTWMVVDDVAVTVCLPGPTPTPTTLPGSTATPAPTAVPSPIPSNCMDILANGDFEWDGAWIVGGTPIVPFYAGPPNPVLSGNRSMALGAVTSSSTSNAASYSSIQQAVTLPVTAQTAQIRFWYFPNSNAAPGGLNRQELILLDPLNYNETIEVLWRVTQNVNSWTAAEFDLTRYLGRTVTVYFNARNAGDGTRTGMFLDQVQVLACDAVAIMPLDGAYPEALPYTEVYGESSVQTPTATAMGQPDLPAVAVGNQQTVIAVGAGPTPLPEVTRGTPAPSATETPRREQGSRLNLDLLNSPWLIILVISGIVLLAVVLALLFFRGDKENNQP